MRDQCTSEKEQFKHEYLVKYENDIAEFTT